MTPIISCYYQNYTSTRRQNACMTCMTSLDIAASFSNRTILCDIQNIFSKLLVADALQWESVILHRARQGCGTTVDVRIVAGEAHRRLCDEGRQDLPILDLLVNRDMELRVFPFLSLESHRFHGDRHLILR